MSFIPSVFRRGPARDDAARRVRSASADFVEGILSWRLWLGLGIQDIRIRYARTYLGPLWITVSQSVTFVALGMLFSAVLKSDVRLYLPYLAAGMVTWSFMAAVAEEGPRIFVGAHHLINSMRIPFAVHVLRAVVRNGVVFLHNFAAAVAAHLLLGGGLTSASLLLAVTLPILFAATFALGLILAILGARFRDLGPIIGVVTQMMFFMTPIMWRPEDIPDGTKWWVAINPAYHLLESVRAPMLGRLPDMVSVAVAAAATGLLCTVALALFCVFRRRIPYWL